VSATPTASASLPGMRPQVTFFQIWNMCFGFLGIQFVFALQNANVSRVFQTLGAAGDDIASLWIAAPLTGLLVQPVIGYMSDRTWNWLGRRRPYFLAGAVLAAVALFAMPQSTMLWMAVGLLWLLDASTNIAMEPFRAFVADQLPPGQRPTGYAMQSFFIGVGSVVGSLLPWILAHAGVSNLPSAHGAVPDTVRYSFEVGAAVLLGAILWTVTTTREYPPTTLHNFADATPLSEGVEPGSAHRSSVRGLVWAAIGGLGVFLVWRYRFERELYVLAGGFAAWGFLLLLNQVLKGRGALGTLIVDIDNMPQRMRELIPVQFFSWLALFTMWTQTTPAVTSVHFGSSDTSSVAYNEGAIWVNVLFAGYNGFAAVAAVVIPYMVRRFGLRVSHLINLLLGGIGLLSFLLIRDPDWLLLSMAGVGFAWASILSLPYVLLADSVPSRKMGVYMGIFNFFIVIPQLVIATLMGMLLKHLLGGQAILAVAIGGASFILAGLCALRIRKAH
jgi:maltose/moltooligosaccharide transporter